MKPPTSTLFPYTIALPILAGVSVGEVHAQGGVARAEGSGAALQTDHLGAGVEQAPGDGPADAAGGTGDHGGGPGEVDLQGASWGHGSPHEGCWTARSALTERAASWARGASREREGKDLLM